MSLSAHDGVATKSSGAAKSFYAGASHIEIEPLSRHIGAAVRGIDLREKPDAATDRELEKNVARGRGI